MRTADADAVQRGGWSETRWQIAPVTRPLLSVGEECVANKLVIFAKTGGGDHELRNMDGQEVPTKERGIRDGDVGSSTPGPGQ